MPQKGKITARICSKGIVSDVPRNTVPTGSAKKYSRTDSVQETSSESTKPLFRMDLCVVQALNMGI